VCVCVRICVLVCYHKGAGKNNNKNNSNSTQVRMCVCVMRWGERGWKFIRFSTATVHTVYIRMYMFIYVLHRVFI